MSIAWVDTSKPMFVVVYTDIHDGYNFIRFLNSPAAVTTSLKLDMAWYTEVYRRNPGIAKNGRTIDRLIGSVEWQLIWKGEPKNFPGMTKGYPKGHKFEEEPIKPVSKLETLIL